MAGGYLVTLRRAALAVALLLAAVQAQAQTLIRDAEIENALRKLAAPIATTAGLNAEICACWY